MSARCAVEEQYLAAAERLRLLCYALQLRLVYVVYVEDEETVEPCGGILAPSAHLARLSLRLVEGGLEGDARQSLLRSLLRLLVVLDSLIVSGIAGSQESIYLRLSVASHFDCLFDLGRIGSLKKSGF